MTTATQSNNAYQFKPIPEGCHTVTPHLVLPDAAAAIEFYKKAFGAEEITRMPTKDGKRLLHAAIKIGNSMIMLCDTFPEFGPDNTPQALGGCSTTLHLYVENVDTAWDRAVKAGATVIMPLENMFWGDRYGRLMDPYGFAWSLATPVDAENLTTCDI